jgi:RNA-binding protein YhbY
LKLQQIVDGEELLIDTNYNRELLYNLEHCIHHQALIKVAVLQNDAITIDANFGVARSTIEYRKQCAQ